MRCGEDFRAVTPQLRVCGGSLHRVITDFHGNKPHSVRFQVSPLRFSPFKAEIPQVIAVDVDSATSTTHLSGVIGPGGSAARQMLLPA